MTMDYRVIIAGGRAFDDYDLLQTHCLSILKDRITSDRVIIVSGGAKGTDALGQRFAHEHGLDLEIHPADWKKNGKAAGPIRNAEMADVANALIAFWDGRSRGTKSMIELSKRKGLAISCVRY